MMNYTYLFGPVQSRRLGVSLGVNMVRSKLCSLDCVYCECGATAGLTLVRKEYAPVDAILAELTDYLDASPILDYITFGGSGEPTLNTGLERAVRFLKETYPEYRCALLTNGTLFYLPEVREAALLFDVVLPSLDAVSGAAFSKVNRPHRDLDAARIIDGLAAFRKTYKGAMWLEIFIVPGINDTPEEIKLLREAAVKINPDRVQLNSLDRPGACDWVTPAPLETLRAIARDLAPVPVEIITRQAHAIPPSTRGTATEASILTLVAHRPSTLEEIAAHTGLTINQVGPLVAALLDSGSISASELGTRTFYRAFAAA